MATLTKGNIIVEDIKIGDIIYELSYGIMIESKVITLPTRSEDGYWTWKCENIMNGEIINYGVHEKYPHYAPNIYNYPAYGFYKIQNYERKSIKDFILDEYRNGCIVINTPGGVISQRLDDFFHQPIEGILYDLNRDFATILANIEDPKWINDYALSKVVVELKRRLDEKDKELERNNIKL